MVLEADPNEVKSLLKTSMETLVIISERQVSHCEQKDPNSHFSIGLLIFNDNEKHFQFKLMENWINLNLLVQHELTFVVQKYLPIFPYRRDKEILFISYAATLPHSIAIKLTGTFEIRGNFYKKSTDFETNILFTL